MAGNSHKQPKAAPALVPAVYVYNWTTTYFYDLYLFLYYYFYYIFLNEFEPMSENVVMDEKDAEQTEEHCDQQLDGFGDLPGASDAQLGGFFSRPVLIYSTDWSPNANLTDEIYPWALFFSNPRVVNRITNFKLLRCNLKVKVVINGNSFYQGRLMVSYNPYALFDKFLRNSPGLIYDMRFYQRQHILCDPAQSTGGEMLLPFIWPRDYIDIPNSLADNMTTMGSLTIRTLSDLLLTSDVASVAPVSVSVFAWAENVTLGGLTDADADGIVPQSGKFDEYGGSKLSDLASTVSRLVSPLSSMPFIGSYARATEIVSTATANIAKIFGFSKPNNLEDPTRMQPRPITNLATTTGCDGALKITLDPKQEVSIDPRLWDCAGEDCLAINKIASIDSLYAKFTWRGVNPKETRLFNTLVDPCVTSQEGTGQFGVTAVGGVTMPFDYWTGSLEFTFEIVASAYHRGRLAVVYDPHETPDGYFANTTYQQIIDISENRKFSVRVGPHQRTALRRHFVPGDDGESTEGAGLWTPLASGGWSEFSRITSTHISNSGDIGNGTLSVFVINRLTANSAADPIAEVLVSVKACEDFKVYVPNNRISKLIPIDDDVVLPFAADQIVPMSGIEPIPEGYMEEWPKYDVSVKGQLLEASNIYVGEEVLSMRSMLKRYVHYITSPGRPSIFSSPDMVRFEHSMYPLMHLTTATNTSTRCVHRTASAPVDNINYVSNNMLNYLRPAFVVLRGSTRWKLIPNQPTVSSQGELNCDLAVSRVDDANYTPVESVTMTSGIYNLPRSGVIANDTTLRGCALTISRVNPALEFEIPFYTNLRFVPSFSYQETAFSDELPGFQLLGDPTTFGTRFNLYFAGGEDLTLGHFVGFPMMFSIGTIPAS